MNNPTLGTTLPAWVNLTANSTAQIGSQLTDEELFKCPSLPSEDQALVDKEFGSLPDAFAKFGYALQWGWPDLDIPKITAEEAIARGWTKEYRSARTLLAALRKEGYQHTTVTFGTCAQLETIKAERKRQQATKRQRKRRERLSPEARAEIRVKDLQYRRRIRSKVKKESTKM
jgi:hypothetical protein